MTVARLSDLSPARRALVRLFSDLEFGRIENLHIQNGEPLLDPPPRVLRSFKFGVSEPSPLSAPGRLDYVVKDQVIQFLHLLDTIRDTIWTEIAVADGLPIRATANVTDAVGGRGRSTSVADAAAPVPGLADMRPVHVIPATVSR